MLSQIKEKVNAGKLYCPPIKRHEVRTNNPFYNGAFVGGATSGQKSMSTAAGDPSTSANMNGDTEMLSPSIDKGLFGSHNPPSTIID